MGMYERRLFLKPVCRTEQYVASGISGDSESWTRILTIPWDKLGYLKRIEIGRTCEAEASGCATLDIWDDFYMPETDEGDEVSGLIKRKAITIPLNTEQINWDETSDIPLIGDIYVCPSLSGWDITLCARLMG